MALTNVLSHIPFGFLHTFGRIKLGRWADHFPFSQDVEGDNVVAGLHEFRGHGRAAGKVAEAPMCLEPLGYRTQWHRFGDRTRRQSGSVHVGDGLGSECWRNGKKYEKQSNRCGSKWTGIYHVTTSLKVGQSPRIVRQGVGVRPVIP